MDDNWAKRTTRVLSGIMRVIPFWKSANGLCCWKMGRNSLPRCAEQVSAELVDQGLTRGDGGLGDSGNAIEPGSPILQKTVPVKGCALVSQAVGNSNFDPIAPLDLLVKKNVGRKRVILPVRLDERTWEATVNHNPVLLDSIRCDCNLGNVEDILTSDSSVWHCATCSGSTVGQRSVDSRSDVTKWSRRGGKT
jgi:hypothetical protein